TTARRSTPRRAARPKSQSPRGHSRKARAQSSPKGSAHFTTSWCAPCISSHRASEVDMNQRVPPDLDGFPDGRYGVFSEGGSAMTIEVYQYPKCGTCRKALRWLDEHGVTYNSIDITENPPSEAE